MAKTTYKHELVEVNVPAGTTLKKFPIPDIPNLRDCQLQWLKFYYLELVPLSVISGNPVIAKGDFQNAFLTLVNYDGVQFLKQAPIQMYNTIENGISGYTYVIPGPITIYSQPTIQEKDFQSFVGQLVDWAKSYIEMPSNPGTKGYDQVFLFSIGYLNPNEKTVGSFNNKR